MKVFVAGCKGQLGRECTLVLKQHRVCGADLPELDVSNKVNCWETLDRLQPDIVVNCAAYTAVDACEVETDTAWKTNAHAPRWLAQWCRRNHAFLVHISTDYVFSGERELYRPYSEEDRPDPQTEYGRSKLAGEIGVSETFDNYAILRTAWLYAAHGKNFLLKILELARAGKQLKVVNDQFGTPTWAHTLARQINTIAETKAPGIYHATSEGYCSWYQLACKFLEMTGSPCDIAPCSTADYPTAAKRPKNSILENSRLKANGANIFRPWEEELAGFVRKTDLAGT